MPDNCTCGAELPPDSLFCHKCGKPQREIRGDGAGKRPPPGAAACFRGRPRRCPPPRLCRASGIRSRCAFSVLVALIATF